MAIGSAQPGEGWALYGSNTLYTVAGPSKSLGTLGEPLMSGSGTYTNNTVSINLPDWGQYSFYTLMATDASGADPKANIVLGAVTISTPLQPLFKSPTQTPEPGTLLMAGTALIGLGVAMKKCRKQA
jgi:hypothetical protein